VRERIVYISILHPSKSLRALQFPRFIHRGREEERKQEREKERERERERRKEIHQAFV